MIVSANVGYATVAILMLLSHCLSWHLCVDILIVFPFAPLRLQQAVQDCCRLSLGHYGFVVGDPLPDKELVRSKDLARGSKGKNEMGIPGSASGDSETLV